MAKSLSDTASVILSNAASRDDRHVLPLPKLKAPAVAVTKTIRSMIADGLIEEAHATRDDEVWEHTEADGSITLAVTDAGLAAIGVTSEPATRAGKRDKRPTRAKKAGRATKTAKRPSSARAADSGGKSKQDIVIALLRRGQGASIEEMMDATGWQAHSVRGFMSGALKKRLGLELVSEKSKKTDERRYHVAAVRSK